MYNSQMPTADELPSSRQLVRSTILAAAVAGGILVTLVLPAEYAIDPLGLGRVLGLTQMGEIKVQLAEEAAQEGASNRAVPLRATSAAAEIESAASSTPVSKAAARTDVLKIALAPGEGAEIKVTAVEGTRIGFSWTVEGGRVNYDAHGDPVDAPRGFYHGYGKGKQSSGEEGTLVAAFNGSHGWFWRNRSEKPVTVTLRTEGQYAAIKRVV